MSIEDLRAFANAVAGKQSTKSQRKKTTRAKPRVISSDTYAIHKLDSPRWSSEQIVYLVTHTRCACGATSSQTNPIPLVRRYHPKYGVHEEAIAIARNCVDKHGLPLAIEHRNIDLSNCHECLTPETTLNKQMELF